MNDNRRMLTRLSAFVIWALIAATAVFWALRLFVHPAPPPAHAVALSDSGAGRADLTRLFGATRVVVAAVPEAQASSRFRILGIVAPRPTSAGAPGEGGVAVIAVDGKPARAFKVGSRIDNDLVLQSVSLRTASIGPARGAGPAVLLQIPPLAMPAAGVLPRIGMPVPTAPVATAPTSAGYVPPPTFAPAAPTYSPPSAYTPQQSLGGSPGSMPPPPAVQKDPGTNTQ